MSTNHEHTPTTGEVETGFALYLYDYENIVIGAGRERFKAWLAEHDATIEAAAKAEAYREAQQIVAGDMTIEEQRGRTGADKVDATYLIQEYDIEIQELQEPDHD